jgi:hypothetical protein
MLRGAAPRGALSMRLCTGLLALCMTLAFGLPSAYAATPKSYWGPGFGYGYGYSYGYGYEGWGYEPFPVAAPSGPPLLTLDNQYFEVGVPGLRRLCAAHPDLCADPELNERLAHLQARRVAGITLAWTGVATAILGPSISTAVNCSGNSMYCRPDNGVVLGTVLGGLAMGITGLILTPGNHDVMNVVNVINRSHPEHPIGLRMSLNDVRTPSVELAGSF